MHSLRFSRKMSRFCADLLVLQLPAFRPWWLICPTNECTVDVVIVVDVGVDSYVICSSMFGKFWKSQLIGRPLRRPSIEFKEFILTWSELIEEVKWTMQLIGFLTCLVAGKIKLPRCPAWATVGPNFYEIIIVSIIPPSKYLPLTLIGVSSIANGHSSLKFMWFFCNHYCHPAPAGQSSEEPLLNRSYLQNPLSGYIFLASYAMA